MSNSNRGMPIPNPFDLTSITGAQQGTDDRALVVDVQDPNGTHYVKIRKVGWATSQVTDENLPWVPVRIPTTVAGMHTATATHGLLPGTMVTIKSGGLHGHDWVVTGSIPNDRNDNNQSHHEATTKDGQQKSHTDKQFKDKTYGWPKPLNEITQNKTTQGAQEIRDNAARKANKTAEPCKESQDQCSIPDYYGQRTNSKDPKGGTIGVHKFDGKNAQDFIQQTIQNKSAILQNALPAIQQLMKVKGTNPTSIESIGAGNFSSLLSQISSWFSSVASSQNTKDQAQTTNCAALIITPDEQLTADQISQKAICIIAQQLLDQESANTDIPTS